MKRTLALLLIIGLSFLNIPHALGFSALDSSERIEAIKVVNKITQRPMSNYLNDSISLDNSLYSDNKQKQVYLDTTKYHFNYDAIGNMTSSFVGEELYAKYNYTSNSYVSSIEFANNQKINKNYDEYGRVTTVSYDQKVAFEYDYTNYGELGVEKDYLASRTTITDDMFDVISLNSNKQLFHIEETSNTSHLFSILETDNISRKVADKQNQTQVDFSLRNGENCFILCQYDDYDRLIKAEVCTESLSIHENYTYINNTSDYVQKYTVLISNEWGNYEYSWLYVYDENGNIISKSYSNNGTDYELINRYEYDEYGQLTAVFDESTKSIMLQYDGFGNILKKEIIDGETKNDSIYSYLDRNWGDKLTAYNNNTIVYDEIGNPLFYNKNQYTWSAGRQLVSYHNPDSKLQVDYTYDEIGHRTTKIIEDNDSKIEYEYFWLGDTLIALTVSGISNGSVDTVYFLYDMEGNLYGFIKNGTDIYLYEKSETGDVLAIYDETGVVANYVYDTFGNVIVINETDDDLRYLNPFYYRSYIFDRESEMYYLLSRYYIPEWGRFLNADAYFTTNIGMYSNNMFIYCDNNPVNISDPYGYWGKNDHRNWTKNLATQAGMMSTIATKIGDGSYSVDISMSTNPIRAPFKWRYNQRFHFDRRNYCDNISGGEDTRIYYANIYISDAIAKRNQGNETEAADLFGKALHFLQDISSHGYVGLNSSFASHGSGFDKTNYDWEDDATRVSVYQISPISTVTGARYDETISVTALALILYNIM